MKKLIIVGLIAILGLAALAQQARVISLSPEDASDVKQAWKQLQDAQRHWDFVQKKVRYHYLTVPYGSPEATSSIITDDFYENGTGIGYAIATSCFYNIGGTDNRESESCKKERAEREEQAKKARYLRSGWGDGFEFTDDFKYIVPKAPPLRPQQWNGIMLNPATTVN
jgi:hypothetical protein